MRKLILLLFVICISGYAQAQNFVSTNPENKKVVLEEYTGIHCVYCPDGHRIADSIQTANPNDVVLINIHQGYFAEPSSTNLPDYRTIFGDPIGNAANVSSYPNGSINRTVFIGNKTTMSRSDWPTYASQVLSEPSPINVAAQASIDFSTRELLVIVETYFTNNGDTSPYKLNVALLQDSLQSPQSGASTHYPARILPNGKYLHKHMLRHLVTGQWGVDITTNTMGHFQADTFRYTIPLATGHPKTLGSLIPLDLKNMEIAVFIARGQQEIVTGSMATMTSIIPTPPTSPIAMNASVLGSTPAQIGICIDSVAPKVTVSNTGNNIINSYAISYGRVGQPLSKQLVTTALNVGQNAVITLPKQIVESGQYKDHFYYEVNFTNYNPNSVNADNSDDHSIEPDTFFTIGNNPSSLSLSEDFQGYPFNVDIPNKASIFDKGLNTHIVDSNSFANTNWNIGGFGNSDGCFNFNFYNSPKTTKAELIFDKIDLSNSSNSKLAFAYAYAQYNSSSVDGLQVRVSSDCGQSWTTIWDKSGANLATIAAPRSSYFKPVATEWKADTLDLSAYDGVADILIEFRGISDYGNDLFIDDINTFESLITGLEQTAILSPSQLSISPNPVQNSMNLDFNLTKAATVQIRILNTLGQLVLAPITGDFEESNNSIQVNTNELTAGVYFVNLSSNKETITKQFIVEK